MIYLYFLSFLLNYHWLETINYSYNKSPLFLRWSIFISSLSFWITIDQRRKTTVTINHSKFSDDLSLFSLFPFVLPLTRDDKLQLLSVTVISQTICLYFRSFLLYYYWINAINYSQSALFLRWSFFISSFPLNYHWLEMMNYSYYQSALFLRRSFFISSLSFCITID